MYVLSRTRWKVADLYGRSSCAEVERRRKEYLLCESRQETGESAGQPGRGRHSRDDPLSIFLSEGSEYEVMADGKFLLNEDIGQDSLPITVVLNWEANLGPQS
jgi:hypothetical protein